MYELDLTSIGGFLAAIWHVAGGVLRLDPEVFTAVVNTAGAGWVALAILFLAGISDMLGQSVVLFANRVTPRRFAVSLVMSAFILVISVLIWAGSIWLLIRFAFALQGNFNHILTLVALSYAPLLFGFAALLPYVGNFIYHGLRIWSFLALIVAVKAIAGALFWQGILACLLGWLFLEFIIHLPILRIKAIDAWLWRLMTGTKDRMDTLHLADRLATERGKMWRNRQE